MTYQQLERATRVMLGVLTVLCAAAALGAFVIWIFDPSGWKAGLGELGLAIALGLVALAAHAGRRAMEIRLARGSETAPAS